MSKFYSKDEMHNSIMQKYENGLPTGNGIGLKLDQYVRWDTKQVCVITGYTNEGKSSFLDFLNIQLYQK